MPSKKKRCWPTTLTHLQLKKETHKKESLTNKKEPLTKKEKLFTD